MNIPVPRKLNSGETVLHEAAVRMYNQMALYRENFHGMRKKKKILYIFAGVNHYNEILLPWHYNCTLEDNGYLSISDHSFPNANSGSHNDTQSYGMEKDEEIQFIYDKVLIPFLRHVDGSEQVGIDYIEEVLKTVTTQS